MTKNTSRRMDAPAVLTFLAVAGVLLFGCQRAGKGSQKVLKLAFVTNSASDFWKIAAAGIHKYEKETGVQVDMKMPPSGTPEEQNQILENLVSQGYDGIALSVNAPNDQIGVLNKTAAKTIVVTFDSDAPRSNRLLYIGTNNHDAGRVLGGEIVKLLPKGGRIAVVVGTFSADNATERLKGVEEAIAGHGIDIIDKREDNTDRAKARSNVEDMINAHPDLNLVVGLWSYNGPSIAAAIGALGKKGKVLAAVFDEDDGTLNGISNDVIQVSVVQRPFQFGYLACKWMHDLATKGDAARAMLPPGRVIETGVEVINRTNVGEFRRRLAEMKRN